MNIVISTLNSKYIHSSLSIRYLKNYCIDSFNNIKLMEFTINQNSEYITGELFKHAPDVLAFSCYIWNIEKTLEICERLKIVRPQTKIVLGGPEVSFDGDKILKKYDFIDFIIYGEGEETFKELLQYLDEGIENYDNIKGLIFRENKRIIVNSPRPLISNLDMIPSPYEGDLNEFKDKIVYFESSRGCPFNCQFCLSSTIKGVRYFTIDRVKEDLLKLIKAGVKQVKFVDRTFNAKKDYALEIMKFIMAQNVKNINFHFEVTAHLLDDEILDFLKCVPEGLFQFEIGVQSTNDKTLEAISRKTNFDRLSKVVKKIKSYENIHQHLDLIAGLPYEDYSSFKKSFNDVFNLQPDMLQLGFLKLLKGSGLRRESEKYGFKFLDKTPYEVLENNYITYEEMLKLKSIEDLLEKYSNSRSFENSLNYVIKNYYGTPFDFFEDFSSYWEQQKLDSISHSKTSLYKIFYNYYLDRINRNIEIFRELLKYDFLLNNRTSNLLDFMKSDKNIDDKDIVHKFLQNESNVNKYLKEFARIPAKKIINKVHFEVFILDILDFIKNDFDVYKISYKESIMLFKYNEDKKVFKKVEVYDITEEMKKIRGESVGNNK
ncbi:radical SAM protein [Caloranaerobacter sp. TR13]|uniref:B12-binding domain-containing radical SAM protein n=1 Tax=Caloranaerobacter sp. TR13 TaxID=1302151 RepID=UPI0006D3B89A|nr:B12-binding domain-containing radical SAM protein [Caloranaerobacter sp. TR13]KPU26629.1 radical SAM protein [Caloranaerobacter sp. TR13]